MEFLSADEILGADDRPVTAVPVPEWGEGKVVGVRPCSGFHRDAYEQRFAKARESGEDVANFTALLIAYCACDAQGKLLFMDPYGTPDMKVIKRLGEKSSVALRRVWEAARKASRMGADFAEEEAKNSAASPNGSSGSNSRIATASHAES